MTLTTQPLVTILTPVYNGEEFLVECIESVLNQSYPNYEYIIVNNCSTDRTLEIAQSYGLKDKRIRIHTNERFLDVIGNHNAAFRLMSSASLYCKVVSADDYILPSCVSKMVALAEDHPSVGIVGCYQLSGSAVRWQGFPYPDPVISGRDLCRQLLLGDQVFLNKTGLFGFGSPTSLLYRADLVRQAAAFYPTPSPHSDTSACFEALKSSDFGFVYEILAYERIHSAAQSSTSHDINRYAPQTVSDLLTYGPLYLSGRELSHRLKNAVSAYYRFLALNYFLRARGDDFWRYHHDKMAELGYPLTRLRLLRAGVTAILREIANPGHALGGLRALFSDRESAPARKRPPKAGKAAIS